MLNQPESMAPESGNNIKLYNLRDGDCPEYWGATFRTFQIFVCRQCASQTNLVTTKGFPVLHGLWRRCPNADESWHWQLEDLYKELDEEQDPVLWKAKLDQIYKLKETNHDKVVQDIIGEARISLIDPDFVKISRAIR